MMSGYFKYGHELLTDLYYEFYAEFGMIDCIQVTRQPAAYQAAYDEMMKIEPDYLFLTNLWLMGINGDDLYILTLPNRILVVNILEENFSQIPLYINSEHEITAFLAKWRLKVGR